MLQYLQSAMPNKLSRLQKKKFIANNQWLNFAIAYHLALRSLIIKKLMEDDFDKKISRDEVLLTNLQDLNKNVPMLEQIVSDEIIENFPPDILGVMDDIFEAGKVDKTLKEQAKHLSDKIELKLMENSAVILFGMFRGDVIDGFRKLKKIPKRDLYELCYCEAIDLLPHDIEDYKKMINDYFFETHKAIRDILVESGFISARNFYSVDSSGLDKTMKKIHDYEVQWFEKLWMETT